MPPVQIFLNYESLVNVNRRISFAVVITYATFVLSILYLLMFHISPDAPLRVGFPGASPLASIEHDFKRFPRDGTAAEMHFTDPPEMRAKYAIRLTRTYFTSAYIRYPMRVYVGTDDHIINTTDQLLAADRLPLPAWLRDHRVSSIYEVTTGSPPGIQMKARPVP